MSFEYDMYLRNHRDAVKRVWEFFKNNKVGAEYYNSKSFYKDVIDDLVEHHDTSKDYVDEYLAYDKYFYDFPKVAKTKEEIKSEFDIAWLKHIHRNPHHWQYWLLYCDDGTLSALPMSIPYIFEMICDWASFGFDKNPYEVFSWYLSNEKEMNMNPETEKIVKDILDEYKFALDAREKNIAFKEEEI